MFQLQSMMGILSDSVGPTNPFIELCVRVCVCRFQCICNEQALPSTNTLTTAELIQLHLVGGLVVLMNTFSAERVMRGKA